MADRKLSVFLSRVRGMAARGDGGGVTDAELLGRFVSGRDEAAFELLVRRHEGMVFSVCRRVLQDVHDAEDAFQATFLALARKGGRIARRQAVAGWLYRVACRMALTVRADRTRRTTREQPIQATRDVAAPLRADLAPEWGELRGILDEELNRLPERFRTPTVLCYLEGKSVGEAARQLGCPRGTVASRLARARARLRARLVGRGLVLPAGVLAATLSQVAAPAAVPDALVGATVQAARLYAVGTAMAGGLVSTRVAALTEGVLKAMLLTKLKSGAVLALALVGLLLVAGRLAVQVRAKAPAVPQALTAAEGERTAKPSPRTKHTAAGKAPLAGDLARLQGEWELVSDEVQGKTAARHGDIAWRIRGTILFGIHRKTKQEGRTYLSINEQVSPRAMDLVRGQANASIGTERAIYKLEGDTLTLCTGRPDGDRPRVFRADDKALFPFLTVFRRVKKSRAGLADVPKDQWNPLQQPRPDLSPKGDLVKLQGTWKVAGIEKAGKTSTPTAPVSWRITGLSLDVLGNDNAVGPGRRWLNLDDRARPRTLDLLTGRADGSIIPERAIYKLEGDVLTLCINAPERPRPTGFRAGRKSPSTAVYTLRRWADDVAEGEKTAIRIFVLKQAPASEVERVLRERLQPTEGRKIHLASEGRINAVIVRVRRDLLAEVEAAVSDLDRKAASRSVR